MRDGSLPRPPGAGKSSFELIETGKLFELLALKPGDSVLDAGCGTGSYAMAMARRVGDRGRVWAVDLWAEGIERLRERIAREGVNNLQALAADVSRPLLLPGDSMDLVLMATVLHDLREAGLQDGSLAEVRRLLRRHGTFAVVEFAKVPGPPGPPVAIRLSPEELEAMVAPFGFVRRELHGIGPHNYLMTFAPRVVCCG